MLIEDGFDSGKIGAGVVRHVMDVSSCPIFPIGSVVAGADEISISGCATAPRFGFVEEATMDKVSFGVANMQCRASARPEYRDVDFVAFGRGIRGHGSVPVPCGVHTGENIPKVARNGLGVFSGYLADATAAYGLTRGQIVRCRRDYQPDPLPRRSLETVVGHCRS